MIVPQMSNKLPIIPLGRFWIGILLKLSISVSRKDSEKFVECIWKVSIPLLFSFSAESAQARWCLSAAGLHLNLWPEFMLVLDSKKWPCTWMSSDGLYLLHVEECVSWLNVNLRTTPSSQLTDLKTHLNSACSGRHQLLSPAAGRLMMQCLYELSLESTHLHLLKASSYIYIIVSSSCCGQITLKQHF